MTMGERRAELAKAASSWVKQFAWKESFEKHLVAYQKAGSITL
jgi:hypothetical protein